MSPIRGHLVPAWWAVASGRKRALVGVSTYTRSTLRSATDRPGFIERSDWVSVPMNQAPAAVFSAVRAAHAEIEVRHLFATPHPRSPMLHFEKGHEISGLVTGDGVELRHLAIAEPGGHVVKRLLDLCPPAHGVTERISEGDIVSVRVHRLHRFRIAAGHCVGGGPKPLKRLIERHKPPPRTNGAAPRTADLAASSPTSPTLPDRPHLLVAAYSPARPLRDSDAFRRIHLPRPARQPNHTP